MNFVFVVTSIIWQPLHGVGATFAHFLVTHKAWVLSTFSSEVNKEPSPSIPFYSVKVSIFIYHPILKVLPLPDSCRSKAFPPNNLALCKLFNSLARPQQAQGTGLTKAVVFRIPHTNHKSSFNTS